MSVYLDSSNSVEKLCDEWVLSTSVCGTGVFSAHTATHSISAVSYTHLDILVQVAAVNAALNSFNRVLLANHIKACVTDDIRAGKEETVDELIATLQKLMR